MPTKYSKEFYQKNKEKIKANNKKYSLEHKMKIINRYKKYYQNNKEKIKVKNKKYRDTHKEWKKEYQLKRKYGLSISDFNNMLLAQNMRCAICNEPFDLNNPHSIHVDHNHKTGKIRGILCSNCNWAIGYFKDNPEYIDNASKYLRERD